MGRTPPDFAPTDGTALGYNGSCPVEQHPQPLESGGFCGMFGPEEAYEEYKFKTRVLEIISGHDTRNTTRPLFLCYTSHLVHSPLQIMNETFRRFDFIAQSRTPDYEFHRQTIAAMAYYMDSVVGSMVGALQAKGMWNNTLWVHQSDNGGPSYTESLSNNFPLRVRRP